MHEIVQGKKCPLFTLRGWPYMEVRVDLTGLWRTLKDLKGLGGTWKDLEGIERNWKELKEVERT